MLRNILIISQSGIVIFNKNFSKATHKEKLIGPLIAAITELAKSSAGLPLSYIEMQSVSVSIATDDKTGTMCVVFHDLEGKNTLEFGKIITKELLQKFVELYAEELGKVQLNVFNGFQSKIAEIIRFSIRPILTQLAYNHKGAIVNATFVSDEQTFETGNIDHISFKANLKAVQSFCNEVISEKHDNTRYIYLEGATTRLHIYNLESLNATVVVVTLKQYNMKLCLHAIEHSIDMVEKVLRLANNLLTE